MWILRGRAERSSVRGLFLESLLFFASADLARAGTRSVLSSSPVAADFSRVIEELAEEWFRDTLQLV